MDKWKKLNEVNIIFGRCAIAVYDDCKGRRVALSLVDKLLESCTLVGGYIESILLSGDNGDKSTLAINEIYRARYIVKVISDNKLCKSAAISDFLNAADNLVNVLFSSESARQNQGKSVKKYKPAKVDRADKKSKKKNQDGFDPDGFDDYI